MSSTLREWESRRQGRGFNSGEASPADTSGGLFGLAARVVIGGSFAALLFVFWYDRWDAAAAWSAKELCVLPRMSLFAAAGLTALFVQGARAHSAMLGAIGLASLLFGISMLPAGGTPPAGGMMTMASPVLLLLRFEAGLMAAVFCGTWLGRGIHNHMQFVAVVLCAAAGDVWLSTFHVPESVAPDHPLSLLRTPFHLLAGKLGLSPAFTDLLFLSAVIEAGRNLRFHVLSVTMGALAGYCAGSFLALDPWPAWPALSMLLCGSGIIVGCWPELKCTSRDAGKAFLIGAMLLATLIAFSTLHRRLHPYQEPPIDPSYYRSFT